MAKTYKRGKNWGIDYLADGRRVRRIIGPNKAMAELALKKQLVLIAENKYLDVKHDKKMKFKDFADEYLERHCKRTLEGWHKSSRSNVRHLIKFFGHKYLHEVQQKDIEKFVDNRLTQLNPRTKQPIVPNTVNKDLGVIRNMFNKATEWGYFSNRSPMQGFKLLKVDNKRTRFLEKEEIARLLNNCEGHLKDIVEFALNTGMRQGEIFNLKWHDVDLNRGLIHVLKTKNDDKKEVPINEDVKNILFRVKKRPDSPYVFASKSGKAFDNVKRSFRTALIKSGIENFRFHDLRHTFASQLVMAGVDLMTVKELLGHKTIEMTLRYSHLSCRHKMKAVQSLDLLNQRRNGTNVSQNNPTDSEIPLVTECYVN